MISDEGNIVSTADHSVMALETENNLDRSRKIILMLTTNAYRLYEALSTSKLLSPKLNVRSSI
jgi:hypothetical protein